MAKFDPYTWDEVFGRRGAYGLDVGAPADLAEGENSPRGSSGGHGGVGVLDTEKAARRVMLG